MITSNKYLIIYSFFSGAFNQPSLSLQDQEIITASQLVWQQIRFHENWILCSPAKRSGKRRASEKSWKLQKKKKAIRFLDKYQKLNNCSVQWMLLWSNMKIFFKLWLCVVCSSCGVWWIWHSNSSWLLCI